MEMPAIFIRAHAVTMATPISAADIHMALTAPTTMKTSVRMPDMIWSAVHATHYTATETNQHYQKRY